MEKALDYLLTKRALLQREWLAFLAVAAAVSLSVWFIASVINGERLATLAERIELKDDEITRLRSERDGQSSKVASLEVTLTEVLSRLEALEKRTLASVLEQQPADVEVISGPEQSGWGDILKGAFQDSGWNVQVGAPGDDLYLDQLLKSGVVLRPFDVTSSNKIREALDAAKIPYEALVTDQGAPAFKVESIAQRYLQP